jgi:hypothetical protein
VRQEQGSTPLSQAGFRGGERNCRGCQGADGKPQIRPELRSIPSMCVERHGVAYKKIFMSTVAETVSGIDGVLQAKACSEEMPRTRKY